MHKKITRTLDETYISGELLDSCLERNFYSGKQTIAMLDLLSACNDQPHVRDSFFKPDMNKSNVCFHLKSVLVTNVHIQYCFVSTMLPDARKA